MMSIFKIAVRNLLRYKRRSLLTSALIAFGVMLVIVFVGIGNFFKGEMIGIITNSNLGDFQIHARGYVNSIDNLPLDKNIPALALTKIEGLLEADSDIASFSRRIRMGALVSNFTETTNMRFTAVFPEEESRTCTSLTGRIKAGNSDTGTFVAPGAIVIPENIASGMNLKAGSEVVIIATNREGSVNGLTLRVSGIIEGVLGPQGKDGYIHIDDAATILQMDTPEITEIAVKVRDFEKLPGTVNRIKETLLPKGGDSPKPGLEVHTWEQLSPFASIANIVTLLLLIIRIVLVFIVVTSILNVMIMSVYERVGEIGTIASIGTLPSKIVLLFVSEGLLLGILSGLMGSILGIGVLAGIAAGKPQFVFGNMNLMLVPRIPGGDILITMAIVLVISVIASLQPAVKASRMQPVEALRHV